MADMTNVDADKLRQTAQKIGNLAAQLNGNVTKIRDAMNNLAKGWQSQVATQFMQNWQADQEALHEMVDQYQEVQELMNQLAQEFDASDNEANNFVGKLRVR